MSFKYRLITERASRPVPYKEVEPYIKLQKTPEAQKKINQVFSRLKSREDFVSQSKRGDRLYFSITGRFKEGINLPDKSELDLDLIRNLLSLLQQEGYDTPKKMEDFYNGYVQDKYSRLVKIGKAIYRISSLDDKEKKEYLEEYSKFIVKTREKEKSLLIVISKHNYDIARMTAGRSWASCMELDSTMGKFVSCDIEQGTIIAYLIEKDDFNIQKPKGRVLIKPFVKLNEPEITVLLPELTSYGSTESYLKPFTTKVRTMMEEAQKDQSGLFKLLDGLYKDSDDLRVLNKKFKDFNEKEILRILEISPTRLQNNKKDGFTVLSGLHFEGSDYPDPKDSLFGIRYLQTKGFPEFLNIIKGDLIFLNLSLKKLPDNLSVEGALHLESVKGLTNLPENLHVKSLHLEDTPIDHLPTSLKVTEDVILKSTNISSIEDFPSLTSLVVSNPNTQNFTLSNLPSLKTLQVYDVENLSLNENLGNTSNLGRVSLHSIKNLELSSELPYVSLNNIESVHISESSKLDMLIAVNSYNLKLNTSNTFSSIVLNYRQDSDEQVNYLITLDSDVICSSLRLAFDEEFLKNKGNGKFLVKKAFSLFQSTEDKITTIPDFVLLNSTLDSLNIQNCSYLTTVPPNVKEVKDLNIYNSGFEKDEKSMINLLKKIKVTESLNTSIYFPYYYEKYEDFFRKRMSGVEVTFLDLTGKFTNSFVIH